MHNAHAVELGDGLDGLLDALYSLVDTKSWLMRRLPTIRFPSQIGSSKLIDNSRKKDIFILSVDRR